MSERNIYRVVFNTTNDALLGPISIYIDKKSGIIFGCDFRE